MKILQVGPSPLTNQEVNSIVQQELLDLQHRNKLLQENPEGSRDDKEGVRRALDSANQVTQYLQRCCPAVRHTGNDAIGRFLVSVADLPFSDDEMLQIINLAPDDPIFFHGLCRDCEARFTEDDLTRTCDLVKQHLLRKPASSEAVPIADLPEKGAPESPESNDIAQETSKSERSVEEAEVPDKATVAEPQSEEPKAKEVSQVSQVDAPAPVGEAPKPRSAKRRKKQ
eukprot:TRINITY_DN62461_c0_g1_i1.p2 TRINITY_DN62461_c0_g1~~TRINITY_DN62461_c0_g1_i1.p2  ORF type:complete len:227 (-),score=43.68 TRINITY_DN62461_c0_g1_i1:315-995(-)